MNVSACDLCGNHLSEEQSIFCTNHHKYHKDCVPFFINYPRYIRNCQGCWEYIIPYTNIVGECIICHRSVKPCKFSTALCEYCTSSKFRSFTENCGGCLATHLKNLTESGYNYPPPKTYELELHESICNICEKQAIFSISYCLDYKDYCEDCLNSDVMSKVNCTCEHCYGLKENCMSKYFRNCSVCNEYIPLSKIANKCYYFYCENCRTNPSIKDTVESNCKCEDCITLAIKLCYNEYTPKCIKCNESASDIGLIGCNHNLCRACVYYRNILKIEAFIKTILSRDIKKIENCMKYECCVDYCPTRLSIPINFFKGFKRNETIESNPDIVNKFMMYLDGIPCKFFICKCEKVVGELSGGLRLNCACSGHQAS